MSGEEFVNDVAFRERYPDFDIRPAAAEQLPFANDAFDVSLAQLVVNVMPDPVAGLGVRHRPPRQTGV